MDGIQLVSRHCLLGRYPRGDQSHDGWERESRFRNFTDQVRWALHRDADHHGDHGRRTLYATAESDPREWSDRAGCDVGTLETAPGGELDAGVGCDVQGPLCGESG